MVLGPADDYLVHQLPVPIAQAAGERNFYDRYWFNGYSPDGEHFFAAGLAVYPQLGTADAAFSAIFADRQYSLRASRHLSADRSDSRVGPIEVEVLEPLRRLRLKVEDADRGFRADLQFQARFEPVEEPRHSRRLGRRILLDSTRLTQLGHWQGEMEVKGHRWQLDRSLGTRDRSWGIRPVGRPDSQPAPTAEPPQFYWLWAPVHLERRGAIFYRNDDAAGLPWNRGGHLQSEEASLHLTDVHFETSYRAGSRRVERCTARGATAEGRELRLEVEAGRLFYMAGIGYMHPQWGHGMDQGASAVDEEEYDLTEADSQLPPRTHVQAFSRVQLQCEGEQPEQGVGVLEQLLLGPHAPSGFQDLIDPASQ